MEFFTVFYEFCNYAAFDYKSRACTRTKFKQRFKSFAGSLQNYLLLLLKVKGKLLKGVGSTEFLESCSFCSSNLNSIKTSYSTVFVLTLALWKVDIESDSVILSTVKNFKNPNQFILDSLIFSFQHCDCVSENIPKNSVRFKQLVE